MSDLRLQLLEPEKHPYLYKCLYGLLMLLPQSTAFGSLRNRLNAVNSMGFMHLTPKPWVLVCKGGKASAHGFDSSVSALSSARGKVTGREDIKWQELFSHFRQVQAKHEKMRRASLGLAGYEGGSFVAGFLPESSAKSGISSGGAAGNPSASPTRPGMRRKVTGEVPPASGGSSGMIRGSALGLSPLNPKAQQQQPQSRSGSGPSLLVSALNIGGKGGDNTKGGPQGRRASAATIVPTPLGKS
jgi:vacuole morphology and inheritance protein 14